jgi:hypothetical protein
MPTRAPPALDAVTRLTKNDTIVRKVIAVVLSLAVQGAALSAPLVHAHPDEHPTEHHAGRAIHTHAGGHAHAAVAHDTPVFTAPDGDRAVFLNVFTAMTAAASPLPAVFCRALSLPVPAERPAMRGVDVAHGHDPPPGRTASPRAPPACLS